MTAPYVPVDVDLPPHIPPGHYSLAFVGWRTVNYLNRQPKVVLTYRVVDQGPYFETVLQRWYNAQVLNGKTGANGRFKLGSSSDLFRDFLRWTGLNARKDRVALCHLEKLLFRGRVEDVRVDRLQRELAAAARYSVLRDIDVIQP